MEKDNLVFTARSAVRRAKLEKRDTNVIEIITCIPGNKGFKAGTVDKDFFRLGTREYYYRRTRTPEADEMAVVIKSAILNGLEQLGAKTAETQIGIFEQDVLPLEEVVQKFMARGTSFFVLIPLDVEDTSRVSILYHDNSLETPALKRFNRICINEICDFIATRYKELKAKKSLHVGEKMLKTQENLKTEDPELTLNMEELHAFSVFAGSHIQTQAQLKEHIRVNSLPGPIFSERWPPLASTSNMDSWIYDYPD